MLPKVPIFMPKPQKPGMGILVSGLCLERQVTSKGMSCPFALSWLILCFLSDMRWAVCFTTWPWPCFVQKRSSQVSTDWNLETVSTRAVCAFLLNGFSQAFWPSDATWGVHSQCAVYDSKSFSHIHNCPIISTTYLILKPLNIFCFLTSVGAFLCSVLLSDTQGWVIYKEKKLVWITVLGIGNSNSMVLESGWHLIGTSLLYHKKLHLTR